MPTYDYKCDECGHEFEVFQSIKDDPVRTCPVCNSAVHRVIFGGAGLIFKGSGFYITDYKNKSGGNGKNRATPAKSTKPDKPDTPKKDTDSSESKSDKTD